MANTKSKLAKTFIDVDEIDFSWDISHGNM